VSWNRKARTSKPSSAEGPHTKTAAVMRGEFPHKRAAKRKFVRLPAWVIFYRLDKQKHVALVRDMSRQGIFFYSDVRPLLGQDIEFVMKFPKWTNTAPIACKGTVVRVERAAPGAAIGIAASLNRFIVLK
jgi:hypothetical protein